MQESSSPTGVAGKISTGEPLKASKSIKKDRIVLIAKCTEPRPGQTRYWTEEEHDRFLEAVSRHGEKAYVAISNFVETRTPKQVRTHAQKFQMKMARLARSGAVLPGDAPPPHTRGSSKAARAKAAAAKVAATVARVASAASACLPTRAAPDMVATEVLQAPSSCGVAVPSAALAARSLLLNGQVPVSGIPGPFGLTDPSMSAASSLCGEFASATVPQTAAGAVLRFPISHESPQTSIHMLGRTDDLVSMLETDADEDTDPGLVDGTDGVVNGSLPDPYLTYIGGEGESHHSEANKEFAQDLEDLEDVPALATSPFSNPSEEWLLPDVAVA
jgi:SHAQKYF class myb-like DNA-binding protein